MKKEHPFTKALEREPRTITVDVKDATTPARTIEVTPTKKLNGEPRVFSVYPAKVTRHSRIITVEDPEIDESHKEEILDYLCIVELLARRQDDKLYHGAVDELFDCMVEYNSYHPDSKITLLVDEVKTKQLNSDYEVYKVVRPLGEQLVEEPVKRVSVTITEPEPKGLKQVEPIVVNVQPSKAQKNFAILEERRRKGIL